MSSRANKHVPQKVIKVNRDNQRVPAIAFLFRDQHIIACSHDGCLQVIEAKTGKRVGDPWQDNLKGRSQICAVDVSPDGERVTTGSQDGTIRVWKWNGKTPRMIAESKKHSHGAAANCVCWSRHDGGAHIASGFDDGSVAIWSVSSGLKNPMSTDDTRLRHIHAINYSHDGTQLLVSGYDREISRLTINKEAWEVQLDEVIKICNNPNHVSSATWAMTTDHHAIVTGLTDGKIKIFELPDGQLSELEGPSHSDLVCAVALSPDKCVLASASYDRTLRLWDIGAKRTIGQPLSHSADLTCAAFATNGISVATGTCDGEIYLWDITEDVKGRDGDATARPPVNRDSPIPTRQPKIIVADPRRPQPPLGRRVPQGFFDTKPPTRGVSAQPHDTGDSPTRGVSGTGRFSRHVKVAVSRVQQVFMLSFPR
ncbi:WD40 repeat-like protein [Suillus weaverae]|nr:WD40 repeat-like protein [Suillus weaverae]